ARGRAAPRGLFAPRRRPDARTRFPRGPDSVCFVTSCLPGGFRRERGARECNFPGWECHGRLLVPICPVAWSLHEILTHFFSLSWTIEHTLGARRPLPTKSYFSSGKKKKVKQHCWFGVRPGGRSLGSLVDLDEGP
ncbi:hypothetical protein JEQ12_013283, partial [Ovis aries]